MNKTTIIWIVVFVVIIGGLAFWASKQESKPGKHDALAMCIADSGAKFYGAFWCPHCNKQKAMFEGSDKLLPYIECSSPDGNSQLQVCTDAGVTSYPTWEFPDGSRQSGEVPLETLAEMTGCPMTPAA